MNVIIFNDHLFLLLIYISNSKIFLYIEIAKGLHQI